eukprot:3978783-Amphidinium_carterae.1
MSAGQNLEPWPTCCEVVTAAAGHLPDNRAGCRPDRKASPRGNWENGETLSRQECNCSPGSRGCCKTLSRSWGKVLPYAGDRRVYGLNDIQKEMKRSALQVRG